MDIRRNLLERMNKVQNSGEMIDATQDILKFNEYAARLDSFAACIQVVQDESTRQAGMTILTEIGDHVALYTENLLVQRELAHSYIDRANALRRELLAKRRDRENMGWKNMIPGMGKKTKAYTDEIKMLESITDNEQLARNTERKIIGIRAQLEHTYMLRCDLLRTIMQDNGVKLGSGVFLPKQEDQLAILDKINSMTQTMDVSHLSHLFLSRSSDVPTIGFHKDVVEQSENDADETPKARPRSRSRTTAAKKSTSDTNGSSTRDAPSTINNRSAAPSTAAMLSKKVK